MLPLNRKASHTNAYFKEAKVDFFKYVPHQDKQSFQGFNHSFLNIIYSKNKVCILQSFEEKSKEARSPTCTSFLSVQIDLSFSLSFPPTSALWTLSTQARLLFRLYPAHFFSFVRRKIGRNFKRAEECGENRTPRLDALMHFATRALSAQGYWRRASRDRVVYLCWQTIKDASECTFMYFLQPCVINYPWVIRNNRKMHKVYFHEPYVNNSFLHKTCSNKSHLCYVEQNFSHCVLQESCSASTQPGEAKKHATTLYGGRMWNFKQLLHCRCSISAFDVGRPANETPKMNYLDRADGEPFMDNTTEGQKKNTVSTFCSSTERFYPWMRQPSINLRSIKVRESGKRICIGVNEIYWFEWLRNTHLIWSVSHILVDNE